MKTPRSAASGIEQECLILHAFLILMRMAKHNKIILAHIRRQIFFPVSHINAETCYLDIEKHWNMVSPFLVIVSTYNINRSDFPELINYLLSVDISAVKDHFASLK